MLPFSIQFKPGEPVYKQVIFAVKKAIVTGQLAAGDRFPSVRQISQELRINPNTAQKVVRKLADEGLLQIEPGIGTIVGQCPPPTTAEKKKLLEDQLGQLVVEAKRMSMDQDELIEAIKELWASL